MDAVVQFLRNAMCCCKDLHLFAGTKLHDPKHTAKYYNFPEPLNQTTPLELLICTTQLYACISTTLSGYRLIMESGYGKLRRVNRLVEIHSRDSRDTLADKIATESLLKERAAARRSIFIGANVISIGISFFWLFANSLHVTDTDWIGGVPGLIHALTVMEIGLIPLLYFMLEDGFGQLANASRLQKLVKMLQSGGVSEDALNVETYQWIVTGGWSPFWIQEYGAFEPLPDEVADTKEMNDQIAKLSTTLGAITTTRVKKEDQSVVSTALQTTATRLEADISMVRMEGYREFLYFILNWIAFYGYMLGIIVYYYEQEEFQPWHIRRMKFGLKNEDADWNGNFAGDLMWTIEPIIILTSPMLLGWLKPKPSKVKMD